MCALLNASEGKHHELLAWECACPVECGETWVSFAYILSHLQGKSSPVMLAKLCIMMVSCWALHRCGCAVSGSKSVFHLPTLPLNELRDVFSIAVCKGAVQNHSKEERMMELELIEQLWTVPLSLLCVESGTALLGLAIVPPAFAEHHYSSTTKLRPYFMAEANQDSPQPGATSPVWHRVDCHMASSGQHQ